MSHRSSPLPRRDAPGSATFGLWCVIAAFAVTMLGTTLPTPLYVLYQREFGFSTLMITLIFATYGVGVVAALLVCGHLSDDIGRRRTLLPGLLLSALSSLVFLLAHDLVPLFPARLLSGLSAGLVTGTATAAIVDFGARRLGAARATLAATGTQMLGLGAGPLLGGVLGEFAPAPLRLPYAVSLVLLALVTVGVWAMPEPVARPTRRARLRVSLPHVPRYMRGVFVRSAIAGFAGFAVLGLFTAVAPSFLRRLLGLDSMTLAGAVICAVFCASGVGQLFLVPVAGRKSLPIGCAGLIAGMIWLIAGFATENFPLMLVGGLLAGLGQGMSFRVCLADVNAHAPPERRADVASAFFLVLYVALALPVVGVGVAADIVGLRAAGIAFSVAVALLVTWALAAVLRAGRTASTPSTR